MKKNYTHTQIHNEIPLDRLGGTALSHLDFNVKTREIRDFYSDIMPEGFENFRISTSCVTLAGQAWSQKTERMC